jgi:DNA-binding FadR family transcriptional regulator
MTELAGVRRGSLVDEVIEQLRSRIVGGAWPVGRRIPPESELIERLQVGRGTLREAVKALAHAGLLEVRQGDGTYVRANSELAGALRRQISLSSDLHVQEVRRALEVEAARLAALRRTQDDLDACAAALAARDAAADLGRASAGWDLSWGEPWVRADVDFHQAVVAAAHNPMLLEMYMEMADALSSVLHRIAALPTQDPYLTLGHHTLLAALRAGDRQWAVREAMHNVEANLD